MVRDLAHAISWVCQPNDLNLRGIEATTKQSKRATVPHRLRPDRPA